jgi:hypothetical protein
MSQRFHPQIRKLTRLVLEIPPETPLPDCSWPQSSISCDLKTRSKLIQSTAPPREEEAIYEVRSVDERRECTLGPEMLGVLLNHRDRRTVLEKLADLELKSKPIGDKEREVFIQDVEAGIMNEISRRSRLIYFYIVYYTLGILLLTQQYRQTGSGSLTLLSVFPLVAIFLLHNMYSERISSSMFVHLIPILLLISYGLYSWILQSSPSGSGPRFFLYLLMIVVIVLSLKLIADFRGVFSDCLYHQTGRRQGSNVNMLLGVFGLIVPLTIILSLYAL